MASGVISWNTMRLIGTFGFSVCTKCQAMASPSRSSSVARYNVSACFNASLNSETVFFLFEPTM